MYTIKILSNDEYDKLPYKHAKTSLGCADQKSGKAFVRATGVKEWDMKTLSHEIDELVAKVSPHEEDGIRYKGGGGTEITKVEDKIKTNVSNPLSQYLTGQIGKGLPGYTASTGKSLSYEDPNATNIYNKFLSINPDEWYTNAVVNPTMEDMKEQTDLISEGYAGSLRGSGRFRDVEDFTQDTAKTLAEGRYRAELEIPQAQMSMAQTYKSMKDADIAKEYSDWYTSLPQNNPAIAQSLEFLKGTTGVDFVAQQKTKDNKGATIGAVAGMIALGVLTGGLGFAMAPAIAGVAGSAGALAGLGVGGSMMLGAAAGGTAGSLLD